MTKKLALLLAAVFLLCLAVPNLVPQVATVAHAANELELVPQGANSGTASAPQYDLFIESYNTAADSVAKIRFKMINSGPSDIDVEYPAVDTMVGVRESVQYAVGATGYVNWDSTVRIPVKSGGEATAVNVEITIKIYPLAQAGRHDVAISVPYIKNAGERDTSTRTVKVEKTTEGPEPATPVPSWTPTPSPTPVEAVVVLDETDTQGRRIKAPEGDIGDTVTFTLPIRNRGDLITDVEISPVISASLDEFPFDVTSVNYVQRIGYLMREEKRTVTYQFRINEKATSGAKAVKFKVLYMQNNEPKSVDLTAFVTVNKGYVEPTPKPEGTPDPNAPKIIISSQMTSPETVMAGQPFDLTMTLTNTHEKQTVKNFTVTISNSDKVIMPQQGESNTIYISEMAPGESITKTLPMVSVPDAEVKAYEVTVDFSYDTSKSGAIKESAKINVPVNQEIRVEVGEPMIYEDPIVGTPINVMMNVRNLGRVAVQNLNVTVEGEGITVEEDGYFGGNVASGATSRADMMVTCETAGEIAAKFIVTFEDKFSVQTRIEKEVTLNVIDMNDMGGMEGMYPEGMEIGPDGMPIMPGDAQKGLSPLIIAAIVAGVALVGVIVLVIVLKRRKQRRQEDELNALAEEDY